MANVGKMKQFIGEKGNHFYILRTNSGKNYGKFVNNPNFKKAGMHIFGVNKSKFLHKEFSETVKNRVFKTNHHN